MMLARGASTTLTVFPKDLTVFPKECRAQIANALLDRQTGSYEATADGRYASFAAGAAASQLAVDAAHVPAQLQAPVRAGPDDAAAQS